jgi:hypothetical protein
LEAQFGSITLDLLQPGTLLVPSAASLTCSPPAPGDGFLNDFNCYSVQVRPPVGGVPPVLLPLRPTACLSTARHALPISSSGSRGWELS